MARIIPFNKPHGFKILELSDDHIKTWLPYKKRNLNHIKGLHACALATLSEFSTGAFLISKFDPNSYRIIMKTIRIDYLYQGKMDAYARFELSDDWVQSNVLDPLKTSESVLVDCEINIFDKNENHLTKGVVTWQIKDWSRVRTA